MSSRPIELLVLDIWEAIARVQRYVGEIDRQDFLADEKTRDAVVRNLEIMGEAASRLPSDFKENHKDIPWGKIVGLRHRIVHDYFGVDMEIVWQIVQADLPEFARQVARLRDDFLSPSE